LEKNFIKGKVIVKKYKRSDKIQLSEISGWTSSNANTAIENPYEEFDEADSVIGSFNFYNEQYRINKKKCTVTKTICHLSL
jgi:hypothetical protein